VQHIFFEIKNGGAFMFSIGDLYYFLRGYSVYIMGLFVLLCLLFIITTILTKSYPKKIKEKRSKILELLIYLSLIVATFLVASFGSYASQDPFGSQGVGNRHHVRSYSGLGVMIGMDLLFLLLFINNLRLMYIYRKERRINK
jgi:membrane protease YdiL (CAAX protease family)